MHAAAGTSCGMLCTIDVRSAMWISAASITSILSPWATVSERTRSLGSAYCFLGRVFKDLLKNGIKAQSTITSPTICQEQQCRPAIRLLIRS